MRKTVKVMIIVILILAMNTAFANVILDNETMYGSLITYYEHNEYPGDIVVDGVYMHQTDEDYVVTVVYSNGEIVRTNNDGEMKVDTSFFNPGSGDIILIHNDTHPERIIEKDHAIQFTVEQSLLKQVEGITIMFNDIYYPEHDDIITAYFKIREIDFDALPNANELVSGYGIKSDEVTVDLESEPSEWAKNSIEELQLEGILRDAAFRNFNEGITRQNFVYLMVKLYEEITESTITLDPTIKFDDTDDVYITKAATIGITDGIGNDLFGPDIILDREQMTTFMIKTLQLAGVELIIRDSTEIFSDDDQISNWAKTFVYTAKLNEIMGGVGDNMFSPKAEALNEQVLYVTHSLLKKYGSLEWLNEYDKERVYLKLDDDFYKITLENNIIVNDSLDQTTLYLHSIKDVNTIVNVLHLEDRHLKYKSTSNPNIVGDLIVHEYNKMTLTATNIYLGVDKVGEITTIDIGDETYIPEVTERFDLDPVKYKNFEQVNFYDLNGNRQTIDTLSLSQIFKILEIDYKVSYHNAWDIYVIEAISE